MLWTQTSVLETLQHIPLPVIMFLKVLSLSRLNQILNKKKMSRDVYIKIKREWAKFSF